MVRVDFFVTTAHIDKYLVPFYNLAMIYEKDDDSYVFTQIKIKYQLLRFTYLNIVSNIPNNKQQEEINNNNYYSCVAITILSTAMLIPTAHWNNILLPGLRKCETKWS